MYGIRFESSGGTTVVLEGKKVVLLTSIENEDTKLHVHANAHAFVVKQYGRFLGAMNLSLKMSI